MDTPIPTPFDIINPGPGALVPTGLAWAALAACALGVIAYISYRRRIPGAHSMQSTLLVLLDQLRSAASKSSVDCGDQHSFERVSRLVRRVLTPYMSVEVATMSCSELRSVAATLLISSDEAETSLAPILSQLAELEEQAYAPQAGPEDRARLIELQGLLVSGIETHVRRFRPT